MRPTEGIAGLLADRTSGTLLSGAAGAESIGRTGRVIGEDVGEMGRTRRMAAMVGTLLVLTAGFAGATAAVALADGGNCTVVYVTNPYIADPREDNYVQASTEVSCNIYSQTLTVRLYIEEYTAAGWTTVGSTSIGCNQCEIQVAVARTATCTSSSVRAYRARMDYQFPGPNWPWSSWHYSSTNPQLACLP